jgi:hypothetical protein
VAEADTTEAEVTHEGTEDERLTRVENAVGRIEDAIGRFLGGGHSDEGGQEQQDAPPEDWQARIRAEVDAARQEEATAAAAERDKAERESDRARLAKLEEKRPDPPVRRMTRSLGWGDGRQ